MNIGDWGGCKKIFGNPIIQVKGFNYWGESVEVDSPLRILEVPQAFWVLIFFTF